MSHNYRVNYAFEKVDTENLPEDQKWGFGFLDINTDKVPQSNEEYKEILRTIGMQGGYGKVKLVSINEKRPEDSKVINPILPGEVLESE